MREGYLAVDLGTTHLKAALAGRDGRLGEMVCRDTPVHTPFEGASEMDMEETWRVFCQVTRELLDRREDLTILGVGISGLGEGLWPVDGKGEPVRPAILWNDVRARELSLEDPDLERLMMDNRVNPLFPGAPPVVLRWMKEKEPEAYRRVRWGCHSKDWLNFRLTGRMATDFSDASTVTVDVGKRDYWFPLFDRLGIGDKKETMPAMVPSFEVVGEVTAQAARESGIPQGTPVIAGALDAAAIALGAGVLEKGDCCTVFGTCLANQMLIGEESLDFANTCGSHLLSALPQGFLRMMGTTSGCGCLDWARKILAPGLSYAQQEELAQSAPPGSGGVVWHPYLSGERAPFKDAFACGAFVGLRRDHTRAHLLRAAYEGMVCSLAHCRDHLPPVTGRYWLAGGGARSALLCRMTASALGREVCLQKEKELGLQGITALIRAGVSGEAIALPQDPVTVFEPEEELARGLEVSRRLYDLAREEIGPYWRQLREMGKHFSDMRC